MPPEDLVGNSGPGNQGIVMILSPAKTLDLSPCNNRLQPAWTFPACDEALTRKVASLMKDRSSKELEKMLSISPKLASTAYEYWSSFMIDPMESSLQKPCIFSFAGAAYQGLQVATCSDEALMYMQNNLRIVDPLYGILRPLDLIQPYRLEMATKKAFPDAETVKLSDFWKSSVCAFLSRDLSRREDKILLNLASDEYSAAVDGASLPSGTRFIKIVFWDDGRTIAFHAKRARGLMVRYLAMNSVDTIEGIQNFTDEGYFFVASKSDDATFVFDRRKPSCTQKHKQATKDTNAPTKRARRR